MCILSHEKSYDFPFKLQDILDSKGLFRYDDVFLAHRVLEISTLTTRFDKCAVVVL